MFDIFGDSAVGKVANKAVDNRLSGGSLGSAGVGALASYISDAFNKSSEPQELSSHEEAPADKQPTIDTANVTQNQQLKSPTMFGFNPMGTQTEIVPQDQHSLLESQNLLGQLVMPEDNTRIKNGQDSGIWGIIKAII